MPQRSKPKARIERVFFLLVCLLLLTISIPSQDLPNKIRGYKVHQANISVQNKAQKDSEKMGLRVFMDFEQPELASVGLLGITLEIESSLTIFGQSGKVDFISFKDFRVNGIPVNIHEYQESFKFKKSKPFRLNRPIRVFVGTKQTFRGALKEFKSSKDRWAVTGRVFVFGKFKKFGFNFKRVIPVDVNLWIDNPLKGKEDGQ